MPQETANPQNAAQRPAPERETPPVAPEGAARVDWPEPQSYVAPDARDASLAPPAGGEVMEVGDLVAGGEPLDVDLGEVQMGGDRVKVPPGKDNAIQPQGRKTARANRERLKNPMGGRR